MSWRDTYADQNLRMARKMLEQQGEVNELRKRAEQAEAERDRLKAAFDKVRALSEGRTGKIRPPGWVLSPADVREALNEAMAALDQPEEP